MKVQIDRDRDGWYYAPHREWDGTPTPETSKSRAGKPGTYDDILKLVAEHGHEVSNGGWKQKLLSWNWNNISFDRYPGWEIEEGAPAWCKLEHVNGDTWGPKAQRATDREPTASSDEVANAWDEVAQVQFYSRDISYDGTASVINREPYGSLWWFRTVAERERFLVWLADKFPNVIIKYRCFAEFPKERSR